ncbi:MAG: alpha/beta fold hydrolase [Thermonemataceae bacterium]
MTKVIPLKNSEIEYLLTGRSYKDAILFLHGLGANLSQFEYQQTYFSEYYKFISVNLRGHGNSSVHDKPTLATFELSKMAIDVIELLNTLNIKRVHFVGNSMGGNVGYEILRVAPQILGSFTTFGTTASLNTSKLALKMMTYTYKILSTNAIGNLSKAAGQTSASKKKIKEMIAQVDKQTLRAILPNIANFNYLHTIKTSNLPCMIIKGALDKSINKVLESTIAAFKKRGNFKMIELQGVGHLANLDCPNVFNKTLSEFITNKKEQ